MKVFLIIDIALIVKRCMYLHHYYQGGKDQFNIITNHIQFIILY